MAKRSSPWWVIVLAVFGALTLASALIGGVVAGVAAFRLHREADQTKAAQAQFYSTPTDVPSAPGSVIRSEPLEYSVAGGTGYRFVYTSIDSAGKPVPVSGRIWIPESPAPATGRKVMAWSHGTVGLATQCAPSRATQAVDTGWLLPALQRGWVVVATDYLGLGIDGPPTYLVGEQEARDVVNSVRAARLFANANAGRDWVVFGASQGGHAALWTADRAQEIAPELVLKGVGAAVPAAELGAIMTAQWQGAVGWVIGPDAYVSYAHAYPERDFNAVISKTALSRMNDFTSACVDASTLAALVLKQVSGSFFTSNPMQDKAWSQTIVEQTPPRPPSGLPMLLEQGMTDQVVLAGSNALLQNQWCAAGTPMTSLWLAKTGHVDTSIVGGPAFVDWAAEVFSGITPRSTCALGVPAPVTPLPAG